MKKWLIVGAFAAVLVVGGLLARDWYFHDKPLDLADDYRGEASGSAGEITGSMDNVFDSFDEYLLASTIPARKLRNVDNVDELRRRLVPVLDDADAALLAARKKIKAARTQIKEGRDSLLDTPSAALISDSDPIDETEGVAETSKDYFNRLNRYLRSYGQFLDYEKDDIDLRRRELKVATQNQVERGASLDEIKSSVDSELKETEALLKARRRLKPARDTEKLDDNAIEYLNVTIDYLERIDAALDALDADGLEAADADYIDEVRAVGRRDSILIAELSADSGLSQAAGSLSERADDLENAIADLGTGSGRDEEPRRRPPPFPPPSSGGGGGSGGGDQGQVS